MTDVPLLHEAGRAALVPPFRAMAISRLASQMDGAGRRILHLEVGQPSTGAPASARAAAAQHLAEARPLGYTDAAGLPALRERIARHYADRYSVPVDADAVLVVSGASAGFTLAFLAAFDAGDRVAVLEPGYPCYRNTLLAFGMEPVPIPVGPQTRWAPTTALLDAAGHLDGLVIASPSNPTGTVLDAAALGEVSAWCARNGVQLIADEIYHGITYGAPAPTALAVTRDALVVNSFSKYFSMTGWRLGWTVVPDHLRSAVERLQQNLYICAPHVSQVAGRAAFDDTAELDGHVLRYAANRAVLVDGLQSAGFTDLADADGAFYVYADAGHLLERSGEPGTSALCHRWLEEIGVATTPGLDFDLARGERFVRFSYAGREEVIGAACELLTRWQP